MKKILWNIIISCLLIIELPIYIITFSMLFVGYLLARFGEIGYLFTRFHKWLKNKFFKTESDSYIVTVKDPLSNEITQEIECKSEEEAQKVYNNFWRNGFNVTIVNSEI